MWTAGHDTKWEKCQRNRTPWLQSMKHEGAGRGAVTDVLSALACFKASGWTWRCRSVMTMISMLSTVGAAVDDRVKEPPKPIGEWKGSCFSSCMRLHGGGQGQWQPATFFAVPGQ